MEERGTLRTTIEAHSHHGSERAPVQGDQRADAPAFVNRGTDVLIKPLERAAQAHGPQRPPEALVRLHRRVHETKRLVVFAKLGEAGLGQRQAEFFRDLIDG